MALNEDMQKLAEDEEVMVDETVETDLSDPDIKASDIVFDCPSCGHNLVVDYRAAGLSVPCAACGKVVQAPIPDGMQIEDLDLEPGELLSQLLQTRRMLAKSEERVEDIEEQLAILSAQQERSKLVAEQIAVRHDDLSRLMENVMKDQAEIGTLLSHIAPATQ